jgi:hypothetical protein
MPWCIIITCIRRLLITSRHLARFLLPHPESVRLQLKTAWTQQKHRAILDNLNLASSNLASSKSLISFQVACSQLQAGGSWFQMAVLLNHPPVHVQEQASTGPAEANHFLLCCRANGALEVYQLPGVLLVARFDDLPEGLGLLPSMDGLKAGVVSSQVRSALLQASYRAEVVMD